MSSMNLVRPASQPEAWRVTQSFASGTGPGRRITGRTIAREANTNTIFLFSAIPASPSRRHSYFSQLREPGTQL